MCSLIGTLKATGEISVETRAERDIVIFCEVKEEKSKKKKILFIFSFRVVMVLFSSLRASTMFGHMSSSIVLSFVRVFPMHLHYNGVSNFTSNYFSGEALILAIASDCENGPTGKPVTRPWKKAVSAVI